MSKKKVYISLPITGCDIDEVEAKSIFVSSVLENKGYISVSPLDVSPDPDATYAEHMGRDITSPAGVRCRVLLQRLAIQQRVYVGARSRKDLW